MDVNELVKNIGAEIVGTSDRCMHCQHAVEFFRLLVYGPVVGMAKRFSQTYSGKHYPYHAEFLYRAAEFFHAFGNIDHGNQGDTLESWTRLLKFFRDEIVVGSGHGYCKIRLSQPAEAKAACGEEDRSS